MLSYPSSFQSSRISDKQNTNPNIKKLKATTSNQSNKQKYAILQSQKSKKSDQYLSAYQTLQQCNKNQISQNSMKTILRQFCSTIQETQENVEGQNFRQLVGKYFNNCQISRKQLIQLCRRNQIYTLENIKQAIQGVQVQSFKKNYGNIRNLLFTDIGELIVEQLCYCLDQNYTLTKQQQKIVQFLIPNSFQQEITSSAIQEYFQIYKEQKAGQLQQLKKLGSQFRGVHRSKIQSRLCSDHFRLEISKTLNFRQHKQRINYNSLCKCFSQILTPNQVSTIFRYIYALQTNQLMPILDTTQTINLKILQANLLNQTNTSITQINLQQKNVSFYLQQHHKQIQKLHKQSKQYLEQLSKKDQQIQRLNRIIDFMQVEKQQNQKICAKQMEVQAESCRIRYEKRIEQLLEKNKQQARLTQWYQRELEVMMNAVNRENVIRKYLA